MHHYKGNPSESPYLHCLILPKWVPFNDPMGKVTTLCRYKRHGRNRGFRPSGCLHRCGSFGVDGTPKHQQTTTTATTTTTGTPVPPPPKKKKQRLSKPPGQTFLSSCDRHGIRLNKKFLHWESRLCTFHSSAFFHFLTRRGKFPWLGRCTVYGWSTWGTNLVEVVFLFPGR